MIDWSKLHIQNFLVIKDLNRRAHFQRQVAFLSHTLNKILVKVGQTGIKNESHLVKKLARTWSLDLHCLVKQLKPTNPGGMVRTILLLQS